MNGTTDLGQQPVFEEQPGPDNMEKQSVVIPVIAEQWKVEKNVVETGKVLISKRVHQEEVQVDIPLDSEAVDVQRIPINHYLETAPPAVRYDGDTMIVPVLREELVVQKRLVLVEELRITKRRVQQQESQQVILRKEEVTVDRVSPSTASQAENNEL